MNDHFTPKVGAKDAFVHADGMEFHCRSWGDEAADPVVLLHGLTGHAWEHDTVASLLVANDRRAIAMDQRGHGASSWTSSYDPMDMAHDVAAVASALGLRSMTLVGASMGGVVAYLCAARYPRLVQRLVVLDVGPDSLNGPVAHARLHKMGVLARTTYARLEPAVLHWTQAYPRARRSELARCVHHNLREVHGGRLGWRFDPETVRGFVHALPPAPIQWKVLREVACPTLVVRGQLSELLTADAQRRMVRALRHGSAFEIAGAGHDLVVEQPEQVAGAIDRYLEAPSGRGWVRVGAGPAAAPREAR